MVELMASYIHIYKWRRRTMSKFKNMSPRDKRIYFARLFAVIIGTIIVAFGNVIFLIPLDINAGGLSGIAIVIRYFVPEELKSLIYNITIWTLSIILWVLGRICIGKEFAYKTLLSTIVFPLATSLFTMVPYVKDSFAYLAELIKTAGNQTSEVTAGNYLICAIFGGVFVGTGVAITFVGGGSTGGVDVLTFLFEKYLHIKQSVASFIVDGTIVVAGLIAFLAVDPAKLISCLVGVVSVFITSVVIEVIYIGSQSNYQADIISDKWEEISRYVQDELERGATIIRVEGGYHGDPRVILRVVIDKRQYEMLKKYISVIDPKAFVTYTQTHATFGEGFKSYYNVYKKDKK